MWSALHQLHNSATYKTLWSSFLKSKGCEADPIFYQYVGDHMFKDLVKKQYVIHERETLPRDESLTHLATRRKMPFDTQLGTYPGH